MGSQFTLEQVETYGMGLVYQCAQQIDDSVKDGTKEFFQELCEGWDPSKLHETLTEPEFLSVVRIKTKGWANKLMSMQKIQNLLSHFNNDELRDAPLPGNFISDRTDLSPFETRDLWVCLLHGVWMHGYARYELMKLDP